VTARGRPPQLASALALPALAALACSTAAPPEQKNRCDMDNRCPDGQECIEGYCYESLLPPRAAIALDVRNDGFSDTPARVEILGEDAAVARILDRKPNRHRVSLANTGDVPGIRDRLEIYLQEITTSADAGTKSMLSAAIELQQASRIARAALRSSGLSFPVIDPQTNMPSTEPQVELPWPRYDPLNFNGSLPLYLQISPKDDVGENETFGRGIVYRQLVRANTEGAARHTFTVPTIRECHRELNSTLLFPDGSVTFPPDPDIDPASFSVLVSMRHAGRADDNDPLTPICDPTPVTGTPATCSPATVFPQTNDECVNNNQCPDPYRCYDAPSGQGKRCGCRFDRDCPHGQVCNVERQQCALDLTDRPAIKPVSVPIGNNVGYTAYTYTYCDEDPKSDKTMEFIVTAAPDDRFGLPRLAFKDIISFMPEQGGQQGTKMKPLCLPTWDFAQTLALTIAGDPVEVYRDPQDRAWVCCDTSCISPEDEDPVVTPGACPIKPTIGASSLFPLAETTKESWVKNSCMPLYGDVDGNVRVTYKSGQCMVDGTLCTIDLSPGPPGGGGMTYSLKIEPPVGSIFQSAIVDLTVTKDLTEKAIALPYRVLLRGKVTSDCESDTGGGTDCPIPAEVLAERVTKKEFVDDPATLTGPFFYTTRTLPGTDGEYVLALNPGVYLLTALPELSGGGSKIGPAAITVVDLRETSPALHEEGGLLVADAPDLALVPGSVYTIELDDFDPSSRVIPLDLTSWSGLAFETKQLDLNDPDTCAASSEGCQIRRLRPGNSPALLTQNQFINYVARAAGD
jgi:hypothetical protein